MGWALLSNYTMKKKSFTLHLWTYMFVIMSPSYDGWLAEVGALAKCLFDLDSDSKHLSRLSFHFVPSAHFTFCVLVQLSFSLSAFDIIIHGPSASRNNKTMWGLSAKT